MMSTPAPMVLVQCESENCDMAILDHLLVAVAVPESHHQIRPHLLHGVRAPRKHLGTARTERGESGICSRDRIGLTERGRWGSHGSARSAPTDMSCP